MAVAAWSCTSLTRTLALPSEVGADAAIARIVGRMAKKRILKIDMKSVQEPVEESENS